MPIVEDIKGPAMIGIGPVHAPRHKHRRAKKPYSYHGDRGRPVKLSRPPTPLEIKLLSLHEIPERLDADIDRLATAIHFLRDDQLTEATSAEAARDLSSEMLDLLVDAQCAIARYGAFEHRQEQVRQGATFNLADSEFDPLEPLIRTHPRLQAIATERAAALVHDWTAEMFAAERRLLRAKPTAAPEEWRALAARRIDIGARLAARAVINIGFAVGRTLERRRIFSLARRDDTDVDRLIFSAVLDANTCDECYDADGQEFDEDSDAADIFDVPYYKCLGGENCRCQIIVISSGSANFSDIVEHMRLVHLERDQSSAAKKAWESRHGGGAAPVDPFADFFKPKPSVPTGTPWLGEHGEVIGYATDKNGSTGFIPLLPPEALATPGTMVHGSPQLQVDLQPGSMFSDSPVWAAGYTTRVGGDAAMTETFVGHIHAFQVPEGKTLAARSTHAAEALLLGLAKDASGGKSVATLREAADIVAASDPDLVAIVSRAADGRVNGGILVRAVPVTGVADPRAALTYASAHGERVPDNLKQAVAAAPARGLRADLAAERDQSAAGTKAWDTRGRHEKVERSARTLEAELTAYQRDPAHKRSEISGAIDRTTGDILFRNDVPYEDASQPRAGGVDDAVFIKEMMNAGSENVLHYHTHPDDNAFSDGDWKVFAWDHVGEMRVVTSGHVYVLEKTPKFAEVPWQKRTPAEMQRRWNALSDELWDSTYVDAGEGTPSEMVAELTRRINTQMAGEYGVTFKVRPTPGARGLRADLSHTAPQGWQRTAAGLVKRFAFPNRRACAAFTTALMTEANRVNHHPDVAVANNAVTVTFITHATDSITEKDVAGAAHADAASKQAILVLSDRDQSAAATKAWESRTRAVGHGLPKEYLDRVHTWTDKLSEDAAQALDAYVLDENDKSSALTRVVASAPPLPHPVTTYRGVRADYFVDVPIGGTMPAHANIISTSLDPALAVKFGGDKAGTPTRRILEITTSKGLYLPATGMASHTEAELLLPGRSHVMRVTGRSKRRIGQHDVEVTHVTYERHTYETNLADTPMVRDQSAAATKAWLTREKGKKGKVTSVNDEMLSPEVERAVLGTDRAVDIAEAIAAGLPGNYKVTIRERYDDSITITMVSREIAKIEKDSITIATGERSTRVVDVPLVQINRSFKREGGELIVHHDFFTVQEAVQGSGIGKDVMRAQLAEYERLGVSKIVTEANLDVGGYAWARYGFTAVDPDTFKETLENKLNDWEEADDTRAQAQEAEEEARSRGPRYRRGRDRDDDRDDRDDLPPEPELSADERAVLYGLLKKHRGDPTLPWIIADAHYGEKKIGKTLMTGTDWDAELNLADSASMRRARRYLGQPEAPTPRARVAAPAINRRREKQTGMQGDGPRN